MEILDTAIDWSAIESFIGFGRPDASVLFLGMEEGVSAAAVLEDDLRARSEYAPYEDLLAAQVRLDNPRRFFSVATLKRNGPGDRCVISCYVVPA